MKILKEKGLSCDDVLLVPRRSDFSTRFGADIDLSTQLFPTFRLKYPIISANMDTITEVAMATKMDELGGLGIIHRFMDKEEHAHQLSLANIEHKVACIGVGESGLERLRYLQPLVSSVLIDIAHGHSTSMIKQIMNVKKEFPNLYIIAGNVATGEGAIDLALAGADCIKVGIGPGCFAAGTRVLMANGLYKNIEDIVPGDFIISGKGVPTKVVAVKTTGIKPVIKVRHSFNAQGTYCTADHNYWCGDLNTVSKETIKSGGYSKQLDKLSKTTPKQSKYKWKEIGKVKQDVLLIPKNIEFNLPKTFEIKLNYRNNLPIILTPSYNVGYLFGFFLGDGCSSCTTNITNTSHSGSVVFYPSFNQKNIVEKLKNICLKEFNKKIIEKRGKGCFNLFLHLKPFADFLNTFGKKTNKHLPQELFVSNTAYLNGLLDGLQDSDGINSDRLGFSNTSRQLTELYFILQYMLNGVFPTFEFKLATKGGLNCDFENCNPSFLSRKCSSYNKRVTEQYQISKVLEITDLKLEMPVYDIEVECPSHSFIADNVIVHNSLCTTRLQTGNGVPQLTAVIETKKALMTMNKPVTIIADGGIRYAGDIIKLLVAGADAVMIGNLFAGTTETPGTVFYDSHSKIGQYKIYRGMASRSAQESWKGYAKSVEGEITRIPAKGPLKPLFQDLIYGMLSGMSYQNARNLESLRANATFILQTVAGRHESSPHGMR